MRIPELYKLMIFQKSIYFFSYVIYNKDGKKEWVYFALERKTER